MLRDCDSVGVSDPLTSAVGEPEAETLSLRESEPLYDEDRCPDIETDGVGSFVPVSVLVFVCVAVEVFGGDTVTLSE